MRDEDSGHFLGWERFDSITEGDDDGRDSVMPVYSESVIDYADDNKFWKMVQRELRCR